MSEWSQHIQTEGKTEGIQPRKSKRGPEISLSSQNNRPQTAIATLRPKEPPRKIQIGFSTVDKQNLAKLVMLVVSRMSVVRKLVNAKLSSRLFLINQQPRLQPSTADWTIQSNAKLTMRSAEKPFCMKNKTPPNNSRKFETKTAIHSSNSLMADWCLFSRPLWSNS